MTWFDDDTEVQNLGPHTGPVPTIPYGQLKSSRDDGRNLEPVDTAAALASGSATRPPPPQPRARALPLLLGSGPSPFEAARQPSKGRPRLRICALTRSQIWECDVDPSARFVIDSLAVNPNPKPP